MVKDITVQNHKDFGLGFLAGKIQIQIRTILVRFEEHGLGIWDGKVKASLWCKFGGVWHTLRFGRKTLTDYSRCLAMIRKKPRVGLERGVHGESVV